MKSPWLISSVVSACALLAPDFSPAQSDPALVAQALRAAFEARPAPAALNPTDDPDVPRSMLDLMQKVQQRYLEGSDLLKSGESARARQAFDDAVDLLLSGGWDLNSTPALNRFFQELIRKIQTDESRYLGAAEPSEDRTEPAVVDELEKLDLIPIIVDPGLKDVVEADLASTKYDIPVVLNERVLKSLNFWLTRGRKVFADGLSRSGRYREMIERTFREESIPLDIMYLAQVESLFKTNALSRAYAKGIWQFARGTAIRYGLRVDGYVDERSDPEKSTRAAARYIRDLFAMFRDWNLVLAAYNWGEGKVQRAIDKTGISDFWNLVDQKRKIPLETKNHVPLIMASIIIARNPAKYGFPIELEQPVTYDRVPVSKSIDLRAAAGVIGISVDELKALNPSLRTGATPPGYPEFELKVPSGSDPVLAAKLAALPTAKVRPQTEYGSRYRVQRGDTLHHIAQRFGVSVAALQEANGISSPKSLRIGSWLKVPQRRTTRLAAAGKARSAQKDGVSAPRIGGKLPSPTIRTGSGKPATSPRVSSPSKKASAPATKQAPAQVKKANAEQAANRK